MQAEHDIVLVRFLNETNIKDLSKIGRSLQKTIIVDNIAENFLL